MFWYHLLFVCAQQHQLFSHLPVFISPVTLRNYVSFSEFCSICLNTKQKTWGNTGTLRLEQSAFLKFKWQCHTINLLWSIIALSSLKRRSGHFKFWTYPNLSLLDVWAWTWYQCKYGALLGPCKHCCSWWVISAIQRKEKPAPCVHYLKTTSAWSEKLVAGWLLQVFFWVFSVLLW